jgi:hypothetical protein
MLVSQSHRREEGIGLVPSRPELRVSVRDAQVDGCE